MAAVQPAAPLPRMMSWWVVAEDGAGCGFMREVLVGFAGRVNGFQKVREGLRFGGFVLESGQSNEFMKE